MVARDRGRASPLPGVRGGFADAQGNPDLAMPTVVVRVSLHERADGGTRMTVETTFPSPEAMDQLVAMGTEEGITAAMAQMDDLLHADATRR